MRHLLIISVFLCWVFQGNSTTIHVGPGHEFNSLEVAIQFANPGDTVLVHAGVYLGGQFSSGVQGTAEAWIYIIADQEGDVIFEGGSNAWQFTDAAYLKIQGFIFQQQTGNSLNFDDGGSYETPAHHIIWENCTFRDMNATGNNDLLKLSGVDIFEIRNCLFLNGADGGSGIDMVGCHDGFIFGNHFENMGSNAIQAKGGTANIRIERNFFKNAGQRAVNLGGSTGLQFFRPIDAPYEAAELYVYSNVFIGSMAPVAFVGCINSEVVNNTIYLPEKWVLRILQETVDESRFPPCGYNTFRNNIMYLDDRVTVECNIGPNTAPETFTFSNNLWYQSDDPNWTGPDLPVPDDDPIVGEDPLFEDASAEDFSLVLSSPAIGQGYPVTLPENGYDGAFFLQPRSIGAFEGGELTGISEFETKEERVTVYPNPARSFIRVDYTGSDTFSQMEIYSPDGRMWWSQHWQERHDIVLPHMAPGIYILLLKGQRGTPIATPFVKN